MNDLAIPLKGRIPLWVKLAYSAFVVVLLPCNYNAYGPLNLLWFCDVAVMTTLVAVWLESPLLMSMQALAVTLPQIAWQVDYVAQLVSFGKVVGLATYMFDEKIPLYMRGLSLFHGWLPFIVMWWTYRLGYDRRALLWQTAYFWLIILSSYLLVDHIDPQGAGNVNQIFGWDPDEPQTKMPQIVWVGLELVLFPIVFYMPAHFLFKWLMPGVREAGPPETPASA